MGGCTSSKVGNVTKYQLMTASDKAHNGRLTYATQYFSMVYEVLPVNVEMLLILFRQQQEIWMCSVDNTRKHWVSAYLRQGTSYQCRDMDLWSGLPPKFNHLFIGPLPPFLENLMQIHLEVFAQSCQQTNNDENIFSLAEVVIVK